MNVDDMKKVIDDYELKISNNQKLLDKVRKDITEVAKPFVKEKLQSFVEREVKTQSEHTKSLSIDKLKAMKGKLTDLLNSSDNLTIEKFSNDALWNHINYKCEGKDIFFSSSEINKVEKMFSNAFQELFGQAGKILNEYGYIKVGNDYNGSSSGWVFVSGSGGEIKYSYGVSYYNSDLEKLIKRYCEVLRELHENMIKMCELKRTLSEQEAVDLWEQI